MLVPPHPLPLASFPSRGGGQPRAAKISLQTLWPCNLLSWTPPPPHPTTTSSHPPPHPTTTPPHHHNRLPYHTPHTPHHTHPPPTTTKKGGLRNLKGRYANLEAQTPRRCISVPHHAMIPSPLLPFPSQISASSPRSFSQEKEHVKEHPQGESIMNISRVWGLPSPLLFSLPLPKFRPRVPVLFLKKKNT